MLNLASSRHCSSSHLSELHFNPLELNNGIKISKVTLFIINLFIGKIAAKKQIIYQVLTRRFSAELVKGLDFQAHFGRSQ